MLNVLTDGTTKTTTTSTYGESLLKMDLKDLSATSEKRSDWAESGG